jgi:ATP-dependent Zn protease
MAQRKPRQQNQPTAKASLPGVHAVRLEDLAGMDSARDWGEALQLDISDYRAGKIRWEDVDSGCVVYGPPGTGKTTFARALATNCGVPLIATSYAAWQRSGDGHLGNVLTAMNCTFCDAREQRPCIVFIDEIDTIPSRNHKSYNADWFNSINNALLEELDGTEAREGIVVIGACNDPSNLDEALLRPGRLGRQIEIPLPSLEALPAILRFHLRDDARSIDDLEAIAVQCIGRSGAEIAQLVSDARRIARKSRAPLSPSHLLDVLTKSLTELSAAELIRIAVHEAGHGVIGLHLKVSEQINICLNDRPQTSFDLRIGSAGVTAHTVQNVLATLLAGRAAEEFMFGDISACAGGRATSDLAKATEVAFNAVMAQGLGPEQRLVWYGMYDSQPQMTQFRPVAGEAEHLLNQAYAHAKSIVASEQALIRLTVEMLLHRRAIPHKDLVAMAAKLSTTTNSKNA